MKGAVKNITWLTCLLLLALYGSAWSATEAPPDRPATSAEKTKILQQVRRHPLYKAMLDYGHSKTGNNPCHSNVEEATAIYQGEIYGNGNQRWNHTGYSFNVQLRCDSKNGEFSIMYDIKGTMGLSELDDAGLSITLSVAG